MKKGIALILAMMMVLVLGLAGCGDSGSSGGASTGGGASTSAAGSTGGDAPAGDVNTSLVLVSFFAGDSVNPYVGSPDQTVMVQMFDTLVKFGPDLSMQPALAESWTESDDGMTITFTLRQDVAFTDGSPLTADDIVFSYETWVATPSGPYYQANYVASVEKVDDYTVTVTKAKSYIKVYEVLAAALYIVPKAVYEADPEGFGKNPVGSGAYTFVREEADGSVVMAANDNHYMGTPQVKEVTVRPAMDYATAALALQSGEVDMVFNMPGSMFDQVESNANLAIYKESGFPCYCLTFPGEPFVTNEKLRQAVYHAVNPENVVAMAAAGAGELVNDLFTPKIMGDLSGTVDLSGRYDPELAKQLLEESGYDTSIPLALYCDPTTAGILQVVQADLGAIGITVDLQQVDLMTCYTMMVNGELPIYGAALGNSLRSLEDLLYEFSTVGDTTGRFGQKSPEYDALAEALATAPDAAARAELTKETYTMLTESHLIVPFYAAVSNIAYNTRITNVFGAAIYMTYVSDLKLSA